MGLISDLLGGKAKKRRSIADVEAAIARLADERRAAKEAIATAMRERDGLLLVDETDAKIADLDASTDRARLRLERLEKIEPSLLEELQALRAEAKQTAWRELRTRYDRAASDLAAALKPALEKRSLMMQIHGEATARGFASECAGYFTPPPMMLNPEGVALFEAAIERAREIGAPRPAPAPKPQPAAAPKPPKAARVVPSPPIAPKPAFTPMPDAAGKIVIVFTKAGADIDGIGRVNRGDKVALPLDRAYGYVYSTVAEYEDAL
jgi:hypothetical protein